MRESFFDLGRELKAKPRPAQDLSELTESSGDVFSRESLAEASDVEIISEYKYQSRMVKSIEDQWKEWFGPETAQKLFELNDRLNMELNRDTAVVNPIPSLKIETEIHSLAENSNRGGFPEGTSQKEYSAINGKVHKLLREIEHRKLSIN